MSSNRNKKNRNQVKFSGTVRNAAKTRQDNRCAVCGERRNLQGHHVVPVNKYCGSGEGLPNTGFTESIDNCVMVCSSCHHKVAHEGDYVNGMARPDVFIHSHAGLHKLRSSVRKSWVKKLTNFQRKCCPLLAAPRKIRRKLKT